VQVEHFNHLVRQEHIELYLKQLPAIPDCHGNVAGFLSEVYVEYINVIFVVNVRRCSGGWWLKVIAADDEKNRWWAVFVLFAAEGCVCAAEGCVCVSFLFI